MNSVALPSLLMTREFFRPEYSVLQLTTSLLI